MKISIQEDMYEVMEQLPQDQGAELAKALIEFGFEGKEPEPCQDTWYFVFLAFKGRIAMSAAKSSAATKAVNARWSHEEKRNDTESDGVSGSHDTETEGVSDTHDTESEIVSAPNDTEKEKEKEKEKNREWRAQVRAASDAFISHLNAACGTDYRPGSSSTLEHVSARLRDGYTAEDLCAVADGMAAEWLDDRRMRAYLRPETLLAKTKFEGYLQRARSLGTRSAPALAAYDQAGLVEVVGGVA